MDGHDHQRLQDGVDQLLRSVLRLQLAERRVEGRIARQYGLSQSDVLALAILVRHQGQTIGHVAAELDLSPGATSTLVDRLTRAGLLTRVPNPTDGRSVLVTATPSGVHTVRAVADQYATAIHQAAAAVTPDCLLTAASVLRHTATQLDAPATRPGVPAAEHTAA